MVKHNKGNCCNYAGRYSCWLRITVSADFGIFSIVTWLLQNCNTLLYHMMILGVLHLACGKCDNLGLLNVKDLT